jgi:hypothetical protein
LIAFASTAFFAYYLKSFAFAFTLLEAWKDVAEPRACPV